VEIRLRPRTIHGFRAAFPTIRKTLKATIHVEAAVLQEKTMEGFVLRYGSFYGSGTPLAPGVWLFEVCGSEKCQLWGMEPGTGRL